MSAVFNFKFSRRLLAVGFAVAMLAPVGPALAQDGDNRPATLGDLNRLEGGMDAKFAEVDEKFADLRAEVKMQRGELTEVRGEMSELRAEVKANSRELSELRSDIRSLNTTLLVIFGTLLGGCFAVFYGMLRRGRSRAAAALMLLPIAIPAAALMFVLAAGDALAADENNETARLTEYQLVCAVNYKPELDVRVSSYLRQGWKPQGGVSIAGSLESNFQYCQALVR